jgi:hypothetical protein
MDGCKSRFKDFLQQSMRAVSQLLIRILLQSVGAWTALEEDYKAFLLPAPKCTNYIKQVLMLELSKTDT